ncbi:GPI-anchored CFEM domain protein B [Penicillium cinerascens]|uniref:GPI-anchored CFEM domain protein B n=1 Tax=Penicillium cinerascens TaxID=70096 RepID=A0A9W9JCZ1_9EURO|nr:GPI-anchored CFEM domain protein B [Penicillium cinerascens]KAJ5194630.1 GPI-anchored CFEM domain protein B [Penicillium cinerascens]
MKFSTAVVALVAAGLANAQLPNVPKCSLDCFVNALTSDGCSGLTDFACHCQKPALVSDITPCVKKACDVADQILLLCRPPHLGSPGCDHHLFCPHLFQEQQRPSETSATATGTGTGSSSSSSSSSSSASSGSSESSSAPCTSMTSSSPAGASTPASGSTPAGTSTPLGSKTGSSPGSTSSPAFNAAVGIKGNMAGVAAIAAAAAYVL